MSVETYRAGLGGRFLTTLTRRGVTAAAAGIALLGSSLIGSAPAVAAAQSPAPLVWAQQAGGAGTDFGRAVAVDASGAATVTGSFSGSATFGTDGAAVTLTATGGSDVLVARYAANGTLQWAQRAGGEDGANGIGVAVDASGNATITGSFYGSATFGTDAAAVTLVSASASSSGNAFVARYAADGSLLWAKQVKGDLGAYGTGVAADASGAATITGYFGGSATFGAGNAAVTLNAAGRSDVFVARYAADGSLLWAKRAGGDLGAYGYGVAVDASGAATVTGYFYGSATFGAGTDAVTLTSTGRSYMFVARYGADGSLLWAKQAGGEDGATGSGVAVDASGAATVTGYFYGWATFGTGRNLVGLESAGNLDAFVARYNADGSVLWAERVGGPDVDAGYGVAVDPSSGDAMVTGVFAGAATFGTGTDMVTLTSAGDYDAFVARFDRHGSLLWAQRAGGASNDAGYGVAVDPSSGAVTVIGRSSDSATFGTGTDAVTLTSAGGGDVFLARYATDWLPVTPAAVLLTDECGTDSDAFTIPDSAGVSYLVDNAVLEPGTHQGTGTVTVVAQATPGHVLAGQATTKWIHTFDTTACAVPLRVEGFFAPVDAGGWNTVKGGATVPLKFRIFDGDTEITDVAVIGGFTAIPAACSNAFAGADEFEAVTTGQTMLRYSDGQYIQNWKTPKTKNACYTVTVTTTDGSSISANFKLK